MFAPSPVAIRAFATKPAAASRLGSRTLLSLDQFIQRSKALSLYRAVIRGTRRIGDPAGRDEARRFARQEFERHRGVTDLDHIRYLLSTGKTEWQQMERYIDGL